MSLPIITMNRVLNAWQKDYDILGKVPMQFQVDSQKRFYFNSDVLDIPRVLTLEYADYSPERINFYFRGQQYLTILFSWPEDQPPEIKDVFFGTSAQPI